MREIEVAAEAIHRHAIDLDQVECGIAAADEQPGHAPGGARLAEGQARHFAQQVNRQGLVALADFLARYDAHAAALFTRRNIDGGTDHAHGIDLRRNLEAHGNFGFERQRSGAESGRGDNQLRARSFRNVQFEGAADRGRGLRLHSHAADHGDLRAGNGRSGWIDNLTFDFSGGKAGGKKQAEGRNV